MNQELIEELRIIIQEDYGEDLGMDDLASVARNLVGYFDLLARTYHDMGQSERA